MISTGKALGNFKDLNPNRMLLATTPKYLK